MEKGKEKRHKEKKGERGERKKGEKRRGKKKLAVGGVDKGEWARKGQRGKETHSF